MPSSQDLPEELKPLFEEAKKRMSELFGHVMFDPEHGAITIENERYLLVRAASLSNDFFDYIIKSYHSITKKQAIDFARQILFDFSHAIGKKDAAFYRKQLKLKTASETFVIGPAHFAYAGWASVKLSSESHPEPHNFFLMYKHLYSFEADSWLKAGKKTKNPICIMNAGYSSGWCEESFKTSLVTIEVSCKARGDDCCEFIMAPPNKIDAYLKKYNKNHSTLLNHKKAYTIPNFVKIREIREELMHSVDKLKIIEERFLNITHAVNDGIIQMDEQGLIIYWNRAAEVIFGYTASEALGKNLHHLLAPAKYKASYEKALPVFFKKGTGPVINKTLILDALTKDCRTIPIEISISSIRVHRKWHAIAIFRDITERKTQEDAAKLNASIIKTVNEGIMVLNNKLNIVDINPAFTLITGYTRQDILGKTPNLLKSDRHEKIFFQRMWHALLTKGQWEGEIWNRRKTGEIYPEFLSITIIKNNLQEPIYYIGVFSDISLRKKQEIELKEQAKIDVLTGLFNRREFITQTNQLLKLCKRHQTKAAVIFIDVDYFKTVNDRFGHHYGDELLKQMAMRLKHCIRESDCAARFGGDEFSLTMYDIKTNNALTHVIKKIFQQLTKPYTLINRKTNIAVSIGIAIYPEDAKTTENLIRLSDEAMYHVKNTTRNAYFFGDATL